MGSDSNKSLHIVFFPLMSPGHFIPMIDMARIFSSRGGDSVISTVVTTPANAANVQLPVSPNLRLVTIPFPSPSDTGLNPGQENIATIPSSHFNNFVGALQLLRSPFEALLADLAPDCIISDSLFPWTADLAVQFNIPRLIFHGAGAFPLYVTSNIFAHFPLDPSKHSFIMDGLPHKITLYPGGGLPDLFSNIPFLMTMADAEGKSYGVVVNTYREMEPSYVDFYKGTKKAWCVGPVTLCNKAEDEKAARGEAPAEERMVKWLDLNGKGSIVYVCFGIFCRNFKQKARVFVRRRQLGSKWRQPCLLLRHREMRKGRKREERWSRPKEEENKG